MGKFHPSRFIPHGIFVGVSLIGWGIQDGDFQTLLDLKARNAFGKIMEAEIHYDFESPHWMKHMTAKNYTPGAGMAFGLGQLAPHQEPPLRNRIASLTFSLP